MRVIAIILLLFTGVTAIGGGVMMMIDPIHGGPLQVSPDWLKLSPFKDYFYPGLILFSALGIGSLFTSALTLLRIERYYLYTAGSGFTIVTWIIVQLIMIQMFHFLQLVFGVIGIILIGCGLITWNKSYAAKLREAENIFWD